MLDTPATCVKQHHVLGVPHDKVHARAEQDARNERGVTAEADELWELRGLLAATRAEARDAIAALQASAAEKETPTRRWLTKQVRVDRCWSGVTTHITSVALAPIALMPRSSDVCKSTNRGVGCGGCWSADPAAQPLGVASRRRLRGGPVGRCRPACHRFQVRTLTCYSHGPFPAPQKPAKSCMPPTRYPPDRLSVSDIQRVLSGVR